MVQQWSTSLSFLLCAAGPTPPGLNTDDICAFACMHVCACVGRRRRGDVPSGTQSLAVGEQGAQWPSSLPWSMVCVCLVSRKQRSVQGPLHSLPRHTDVQTPGPNIHVCTPSLRQGCRFTQLTTSSLFLSRSPFFHRTLAYTHTHTHTHHAYIWVHTAVPVCRSRTRLNVTQTHAVVSHCGQIKSRDDSTVEELWECLKLSLFYFSSFLNFREFCAPVF